MKNSITTKIGLEVHIQLKTKRKMFCFCSNKGEDEKPNTFVCPTCLGMPGTLPATNIEAVKKVIKLGLAIGCEISKRSKFDRKHYFYPDLPKGYQISQYDMPIVKSGSLSFVSKGQPFEVGINRIHLEEDAGKLIHNSSNFTIVDLNRAGTPLAELVTEPDIKNPAQAKVFMQELQKIVRATDISDANMEKGHMRCDANISISDGVKRSPIVEIKNLNSFKFVEKALVFEEARLINEFGKFVGNESKVTRGFDSKSGQTYALRSKEEAKDYRYFPEPDIPPLDFSDINFIDIDQIRDELPKLPSDELSDLISHGLSLEDAELIIRDKDLISVVADVIKNNPKIVRRVVKILINEKGARDMDVKDLVNLCKSIEAKAIPSNIVRNIISGQENLEDYLKVQSSDGGEIEEIIDKVIIDNPEPVAKYRTGKKETIGFLMGQVMRRSAGKANPNDVKKSLENKLGG